MYFTERGDASRRQAAVAEVVQPGGGPFQIGWVQEQVEVSHRARGDVGIDQGGEVRAFEDDDRYVVVVEGVEHEGKVLVEQGVPGAGHEIDFAQALPERRGGRGWLIVRELMVDRGATREA